MKNQPRKIVAVVDDDEAVLNALSFALDTAGFDVRAFRTARALREAPGLDRMDCLVVDQLLPDASGLDVLTRLRAQGVGVPAVIITTNPSRQLLDGAAALAVPVVEKPLLGDRLFSRIRALTS